MSSASPRKVVFTPDTILAALYDPGARALLEQWRDGALIPVLDRELLLMYLKTLRRAGLGPALLRRWTLWFTSPVKSIFLEHTDRSQESLLDLCHAIAAAHHAEIPQWRKRFSAA